MRGRETVGRREARMPVLGTDSPGSVNYLRAECGPGLQIDSRRQTFCLPTNKSFRFHSIRPRRSVAAEIN